MSSRTRFTRRLPAAVAVAGLALAAAACGGGSTNSAAAPAATADQLNPNADLSKQSVNVTVWDGYTPKELPQKVKDKLKFPLKIGLHDTNETAMTKLTAGGDSGIDVAFVSGQYAQALNEQGLLEPIHPELIPNLSNLYPEATQLSYDKGNKYSVPYTWGTTGICYRSDLVKTPPTSWRDILSPPAWADKKVTMMTTERWLALPALKALHYSVNTDKDDEIAAAKKLLVEAKPHLLGYDDTTFGDKLKSGEAVIHSWAAANINYKVPNKAAMDKVTIPEGSLLGIKPAELLNGESIIDLGQASLKYTRMSTEITAQS